MQNNKQKIEERKESHSIQQWLYILHWHSSELLERVNTIARSKVVTTAHDYYPRFEREQREYIQSHYKPLSRMTIYRAITGKKHVSSKVYTLIQYAIVDEYNNRHKNKQIDIDQVLLDTSK